MKSFYRTSIFCFMLSIFYPCFSEEITLETAIEKAKENNKELKTQQITLQQALLAKQNTWNNFLPTMNISGGISNSHSFNGNTEATNTWNAGGNIGLSLSAGIPYQMKTSNISYQLALLAWQETERSVITSITTSFYSLVAEKENIDILQSSLTLAETQYEQTKTKYKSGLASELDLLQAQYAFESAKPSLQEAKNTYEYDKASFFLSIGITDSKDYEITGSIEIPKISLPASTQLVNDYLENRIDIQQKTLNAEQAEVSKMLSIMQNRTPTINLSENISLSENSAADSSSINTRGTFSASVSLPLNAFIPGSATTLAIKAKTDAKTTAELDLAYTRTKGEIEIQNAYQKVQQLKDAIDVSELNSQISSRSYDLALQGYRGGLVSQKDLNEYQIKMTEAKTAVSNTKIKYLSSLYALASSLNISIDDLYSKFTTK